MDPNLLISAFFALGIGLLFLGLDLVISSRSGLLESRMSEYGHLTALETGETKPKTFVAAPGKTPPPSDWKRSLAVELGRAGLLITPSEYVILSLLLSLLGVLIGVFLARNVILGLVGFAVGMYSPRLYVRYLQNKRLEEFTGLLDSAMTLLANTLRAGYGVAQGFEVVANESAPPLSVEFARVVREIALGLSLRDALANLLRRNPIFDLDLAISAINVAHESGGSLSDVLDRIATTIRERVRLAAEVRAMTSQQRLSAGILMLLPFALGLAITLVNPDYVSPLWTESCGLMMIGAALFMMVMGLVTIRRILTFKY